LGGHFDIEEKTTKISEIEKIMNEPNFWDDIDKANNLNKELTLLKKETSTYNNLTKETLSNNEILELLEIEFSDELANELDKDINTLYTKIEELEIATLLNGEYASSDCYLEIHPGAGGTESCDWASMLLRMYKMFCEKNNYTGIGEFYGFSWKCFHTNE